MDSQQLKRREKAQCEKYHNLKYQIINDYKTCGIIKIGGLTNHYEITYYRNGNLECSCPDNLKKLYLCKHICYIYDVLLGLEPLDFYQNKCINKSLVNYVHHSLTKMCPVENESDDDDGEFRIVKLNCNYKILA